LVVVAGDDDELALSFPVGCTGVVHGSGCRRCVVSVDDDGQLGIVVVVVADDVSGWKDAVDGCERRHEGFSHRAELVKAAADD
jgi:hypothetical protein